MIELIVYPGVAFVLMIIIIAIIMLLRHGPKLCHTRHHTLPDRERDEIGGSMGGYAQSVSYDV